MKQRTFSTRALQDVTEQTKKKKKKKGKKKNTTIYNKATQLTSMLNSTPPIGAPKFDATPTAHAAASISSRRTLLACTRGNAIVSSCSVIMLAMCTKGPSFPKGSPLPMENIRPNTFASKVLKDRYCFKGKPINMTFI